jgi:hypothetical protein
MYFPYFRGRQYELLALKELAQGGLLGKSVIPVVEPIKLTSTFNSAIKAYVDSNQSLALILNPAVGDLSSGTAIDMVLPSVSGTVIPSVIMGKDTEIIANKLAASGVRRSNILVVMTNRDYLDSYLSLFSDEQPRYTMFPDERQIRRTVSKNKVMFEDKFNKKDKNADYCKQKDEFFSEDHLYFKSEGYDGFGDYSIIGDEYIEGGFAPYAVALHIVYLNDKDILRIKHFVSVSNDDISDVAGKFHEAVSRLLSWYNSGQTRQLTAALSTILSHAENGYYPGLPTIKKLSIMHHLELMGKYLDGGLTK